MGIFDIFFPKQCVGCGAVGRYFCLRCRSTIHVIAPNEAICPVCEKPAIGGVTHPRCKTLYGLDGLTSFFHYDGIVRKAVKALKYRYISHLSEEFVSLIPERIIPNGVLVPIPLHPSRLRFRGFNQAETLGTFLHIPMRTDILRRLKITVPQVEIGRRSERLKNMTKVFQAKQPPANVILFDDVFTTGATMRSAAQALKRAGAHFVWAVTMAR